MPKFPELRPIPEAAGADELSSNSPAESEDTPAFGNVQSMFESITACGQAAIPAFVRMGSEITNDLVESPVVVTIKGHYKMAYVKKLAIRAVREELAYSRVVRPKLALMDNGIVTEVQATKCEHLAMVLHRLHAQAPDGIIFLSVEAEDPP